MTLTRDSVLALQRHYLGALSRPARTWLEPLPAARLAYGGPAVRMEGDACVVDFGVVAEARGAERFVRVFRPGGREPDIRVAEVPEGVEAEWVRRGDGAIRLAIRLTADVDGTLSSSMTLLVREGSSERAESLSLRVVRQQVEPVAAILFNGASAPQPFEFDDERPAYVLSVANRGTERLITTLADLPEWLEVEVDGVRRSGPMPGDFFERAAPFEMTLRPRYVGAHRGSVALRTNDLRPELRNVHLPLSSRFAPLRPHVRALPPPHLYIETVRPVTAPVRLENWGRTPAPLRASVVPLELSVGAIPVVPAAADGKPGTALLQVRIDPRKLVAGPQAKVIELDVDGSDPARCTLTLQIVFKPPARRRPVAARPEIIGMLLALLLLAIVLFAVNGGFR